MNPGYLVSGAPNNPSPASGPQNAEMVKASLPYNDPADTTPVTNTTITCFGAGVCPGTWQPRVALHWSSLDNGLSHGNEHARR